MNFREKKTTLSTVQYFEELAGFRANFTSGLAVHQVDFDPKQFLQLTQDSASLYEILPSSDGPIAVVQESPGIAMSPGTPVDFSHRSDFFDLHKDGLYYPQLPPLALLHCADKGTSGIPTFFVDTQKIIEGMGKEEFEVIKNLELVYEKKDGSTHVRNVLEPHSQTGEPIINLGSTRTYVRQMPDQLGNVSAREATRSMGKVFDLADEVALQHSWETGQVVLFDNERYAHGRGRAQSQTSSRDTTRRLHRIWINPKTL